MRILLVGNGKMAEAIRIACYEKNIGIETLESFQDPTNTVAIHVGSGREFDQLLAICQKNNMPLIQGSTGIPIPECNMLYINVPNACIELIDFLQNRNFSDLIKNGFSLEIIESHQSTKKTISGTAKMFMELLGIEDCQITSIRDPEIQRALGIPEENLDCHAYHKFIFRKNEFELTASTKIFGREQYANGFIEIAEHLNINKKQIIFEYGLENNIIYFNYSFIYNMKFWKEYDEFFTWEVLLIARDEIEYKYLLSKVDESKKRFINLPDNTLTNLIPPYIISINVDDRKLRSYKIEKNDERLNNLPTDIKNMTIQHLRRIEKNQNE